MHLIHDQKGGREQIWVAVEDYGHGPVWEFYVYGVRRSGDPVVCPSVGKAFEMIGADPAPALALCPQLGQDGPKAGAN